MSYREVRQGINESIRKYIQKYGLTIGIIIICVAIFAGITAFTDFITFLPFSLAIDLSITFSIIALIVLTIWGLSRSTLKTTSLTDRSEMSDTTDDAGSEEQYEYIKYKYLIGRGILELGPLRDVALRVETLQIILNAIVENVSDCETILELTGKKVGESFAENFQGVLNSDSDLRGRNLSFTEKFNRWLKYDSKTGMGQYSGNLDQNYEGEITIENSFLTYQRRSQRHKPLCAFMRGYIEGMLQEMSGSHHIKVLHLIQEGTCGFFDKNPERCVFTIQNTRIHPLESK